MKFTLKKPTKPGWYWCRNAKDQYGTIWEGIARIDHASHGSLGLVCSWMTAAGVVGLMHCSDWHPKAQWAGPIKPPK